MGIHIERINDNIYNYIDLANNKRGGPARIMEDFDLSFGSLRRGFLFILFGLLL